MTLAELATRATVTVPEAGEVLGIGRKTAYEAAAARRDSDAAPRQAGRRPGSSAARPLERNAGERPVTSAKQAKARADALAVGLAAVAEGVFPPSAELLDALSGLAFAIVFDLELAELPA